MEIHTPDLPGHGSNPLDLSEISLKRYVSSLAVFIQQLQKPVGLVGHSMAGMVISQVAELIPESIERLVYLAAYLPRNGQSLFDLIESNHATGVTAPVETVMTMTADKRQCGIPADRIASLFYNRCPSEIIPKTFPKQATLPLSGKVRLSGSRFGKLPKSYICCLDDCVIPIAHQRYMLTQQSCDEMIQLDADHSPFLSCPEVLAAILGTMVKTS